MKLILRNIGKIKEAEIDLDKQLTVFFGPNNNGKTYVSYCLYGLSKISDFERIRNVDDLNFFNVDELFRNGSAKIEFATITSKRIELKNVVNNSFQKFLPELFGNSDFDNSKSQIYYNFFDNDNLLNNYLQDFNLPPLEVFYAGGNRISFEKVNNFINVEIKKDNIKNKNLKLDTTMSLIEYLFFEGEPSYFLPAERIGVAVFGKELVLNRFQNTSGIVKKENFTSYSLIINEAIQRQFQMTNLQTKKVDEEFVLLAVELEREILNGKLTVNEAGDAFYSNENLEPLSIFSSASTIKSLSSLVFYLRYFAAKGQTLFIDEPEINLHPDNQRKIARFLAKLSNAGIKIFLSTHSDYLLREFNTLLMLNKSSDETDKLMEKYGFKKEEVLSHKSVGAYLFKDGFAKEIEVTETGFSAETIDETISEQNKAFNDIRWTLFED